MLDCARDNVIFLIQDLNAYLDLSPFLNDQTELGRETPLHAAIEHNHFDIAKLLVSFGADTSITNQDGKTPIDLAQLKEFDLES